MFPLKQGRHSVCEEKNSEVKKNSPRVALQAAQNKGCVYSPTKKEELDESFPMAPCTPASSNPVTYSNSIHTQNRTLHTLHDTYRTVMRHQHEVGEISAGFKLSTYGPLWTATYRSHSPELGWTHGDHLTPSRGCSIRPLLMAAAAGQPHLHVQSCLKFHAADAEADPSIPLVTPVPLELTKSTQSEPHGDGNAGPLSARCRRSEDDATRPFKQIWPLQAPRR